MKLDESQGEVGSKIRKITNPQNTLEEHENIITRYIQPVGTPLRMN